MWKWKQPDPNDERYKGLKIEIFGKQIWIEVGRDFMHQEPRPGRPIPDEDRR